MMGDDLHFKKMGPMHAALTGLWRVWRGYEQELVDLREKVELLHWEVEALRARVEMLSHGTCSDPARRGGAEGEKRA